MLLLRQGRPLGSRMPQEVNLFPPVGKSLRLSWASASDPPSPRPPPCKRGAELSPVLAEPPCGEAATLMRGAEPQCVETQTDKWLSACELPEPNPVSLMRMSGTRQWESAVKADEVQENMAQSRGRCATSYDDKPILSKTTTTGCTIISRALPLQRLEDPCGEASSPLMQQHGSPDTERVACDLPCVACGLLPRGARALPSRQNRNPATERVACDLLAEACELLQRVACALPSVQNGSPTAMRGACELLTKLNAARSLAYPGNGFGS